MLCSSDLHSSGNQFEVLLTKPDTVYSSHMEIIAKQLLDGDELMWQVFFSPALS